MNVPRSCLILFLVCSLATAEDKNAVDAANAKSLALVGRAAPNFSLPDLNQKMFNLADRRGQVVVLAFWATWCPPCRSEMPIFAKLQKDLETEGVAIVPVAFDEPAKARDFLKKKNLDVWSLMDESGKAVSLYGARALPRTFVINREGIVVKALIVKISEPELRAAIEAARR